jgi:hypothetical protein
MTRWCWGSTQNFILVARMGIVIHPWAFPNEPNLSFLSGYGVVTLPSGRKRKPRYNSVAMLKLFRTLARVFPQYLMISQAVAFHMFLAFFAILLIVLGLMKSTLEGKTGQLLFFGAAWNAEAAAASDRHDS